jgi:hypothetical protein
MRPRRSVSPANSAIPAIRLFRPIFAAQRLIDARRIALFGIGHCAILADFLALRLQRSGYDAHALQDLDWQAVDRLAGFRRGGDRVRRRGRSRLTRRQDRHSGARLAQARADAFLRRALVLAGARPGDAVQEASDNAFGCAEMVA